MVIQLLDEIELLNEEAPGELVSDGLVRARRLLYELPGPTLKHTIALYVRASELDDPALKARAMSLKGQIALHTGDAYCALALSMKAQKLLERTDDPAAIAEIHCLTSRVSYFTGALAKAFDAARVAISYADQADDPHLRLFARRNASFVFGTAELPGSDTISKELVDIAVAAGDRWEEAIARNNWATDLLVAGQNEAALNEIDLATAAARESQPNLWLRALLLCTQAEIELEAGMFEQAVRHSDRSRALLDMYDGQTPYVLSATVNAQIRARTALGDFNESARFADEALAQIGDTAAGLGGEIFSALAEALRAAGRLDEAYDALAQSVQMERAAVRELERMRANFERASFEVTMLRDQLEHDWLTGLYNRRFLARATGGDCSDRFVFPLSLAVVDVDHFKGVNDTYGHAVGDQVLVRLAQLMRTTIRSSDLLVRSGGEEFLLVMPDTSTTVAMAVSERLRAAIEKQTWDGIAPELEVTVSIGVTGAVSAAEFDTLIDIADVNLYAAKRRGRNRVVTVQAPDLLPGLSLSGAPHVTNGLDPTRTLKLPPELRLTRTPHLSPVPNLPRER